jgi:hypothetical protein
MVGEKRELRGKTPNHASLTTECQWMAALIQGIMSSQLSMTQLVLLMEVMKTKSVRVGPIPIAWSENIKDLIPSERVMEV